VSRVVAVQLGGALLLSCFVRLNLLFTAPLPQPPHHTLTHNTTHTTHHTPHTALAAFTLSSFLPLIISNMLSGTVLSAASATAGAHQHSVHAALLATVPHLVAFLSTLLVAWHADRTNEKTAHVGVPYVLGAVVLACFGAVSRVSLVGGFVVLTVAMGLAFGGQSTMCARVAGAC